MSVRACQQRTIGRYRICLWTLRILAVPTKPSFVSTRKAARAVLRGLFFANCSLTFLEAYKLRFPRQSKSKLMVSAGSYSPTRSQTCLRRLTSSTAKTPTSPSLTTVLLLTARNLLCP